jgi:hypothetical protein
MQKTTAKFLFLVISAFIFSSSVAYADQCPSNQVCSNNMPIVPEFKNPLATNTTQSQNSNTVTLPQVVNNTNTTNSNQTLTVPVIPVTPSKVEVPSTQVPVLTAPSEIVNNNTSAQSIPTITVPEFNWPDKIVTPVEKSEVNPAYPTPSTEKKDKNKNDKNKNDKDKNSRNNQADKPESVNPFPALPVDNNSSSSLLSQIFILGLGAVMAVSYNAIKQRSQAIKNK